MYKLLMVILLSLSFSFPAMGASAEAPSDNFNKNLAMLGGGVLGIVLASGAVGLVSSGTLMYEGAAVADAMEAGAGLSLPVTFLSAVLGAVFAQDFVLRNIRDFNSSGEVTHH
jgi:hypothetical protein